MAKAARVNLLVLDVDGVLTDGRLLYTSSGEEIQAFHVHDGLGIKMLSGCGIRTCILTARDTEAVRMRAREIGVDLLYQGKDDKLSCFTDLLERLGISADQTAAMGDDWIDLPILRRAGLSITTRDAAPRMADYVDYVTEKPGGCGAVREVCELILKAKNLWAGCLDHYLDSHL